MIGDCVQKTHNIHKDITPLVPSTANTLKQISESRTESRRRARLRNLHVVNIALLAHLQVKLLNLCLLEFLVLADEAEAQDSGQSNGYEDEDCYSEV